MDVVGFGKYDDCTYEEVIENHPEYVDWAREENQRNPSTQLQAFLNNVEHTIHHSSNQTILRNFSLSKVRGY